jgi:hypothetical protein
LSAGYGMRCKHKKKILGRFSVLFITNGKLRAQRDAQLAGSAQVQVLLRFGPRASCWLKCESKCRSRRGWGIFGELAQLGSNSFDGQADRIGQDRTGQVGKRQPNQHRHERRTTGLAPEPCRLFSYL